MLPKAVAEQSGDVSQKAGDSYALAVEPDASQAAILERMLGTRIGGTLKVVGSTEEAFAELEFCDASIAIQFFRVFGRRPGHAIGLYDDNDSP